MSQKVVQLSKLAKTIMQPERKSHMRTLTSVGLFPVHGKR